MKSLTIFLNLFCIIWATPLSQLEAERRFGMVSSMIDYQTVLFLSKEAHYVGYTQISFSLESKEDFFIDYHGDSVFELIVNGEKIDSIGYSSFMNRPRSSVTITSHISGRIKINSKNLIIDPGSVNTIVIGFRNKYSKDGTGLQKVIDSENYQYIYCQNMPFYFNKIHPSIDQPDLKGFMTFVMVTPTDWMVVSNSSIIEEKPLKGDLKMLIELIDKNYSANSEYKITHFEETSILPTFLFNFMAGDFKEFIHPADSLQREVEDNDIRIYVPASLKKFEKNQQQDIFSVVLRGLQYFNEFFTDVAKQKKLALVFCPESIKTAFAYPGSILISDDHIFDKDNPTRYDEFKRALIIWRLLAQLWLGSTVTIKWWNDLWFIESIAIYMSFLVAEHLIDKLNYKNIYAQTEFSKLKDIGYFEDLITASSISNSSVNTTDEAIEDFNNSVFYKGAALFDSFFGNLGEKDSKAILNIIVSKGIGSNISFQNFMDFITTYWKEYHDNEDTIYLEMFKTYVSSAGVKTLSVIDKSDTEIVIKQEQSKRKNGFVKYITSIGCYSVVGDAMMDNKIRVFIDAAETTKITMPEGQSLSSCYAYIIDSDDECYVNTKLDAISSKFFIKNFHLIPKVTTKFLIIRSIYDNVADAEVDPKIYLDFLLNLDFINLNIQLLEAVIKFATIVIKKYLRQEDYLIYSRRFSNVLNETVKKIKEKNLFQLWDLTIESFITVTYNEFEINDLIKLLDEEFTKRDNDKKDRFSLTLYQMYWIIFKKSIIDNSFDYDKYLNIMKKYDTTTLNNDNRISIEVARLDTLDKRNIIWFDIQRNFKKIPHRTFEYTLYCFFYESVNSKLKDKYYDEFIKDDLNNIKYMPKAYQAAFFDNAIRYDDQPEFYIDHIKIHLANNTLGEYTRKELLHLSNIMEKRANVFNKYGVEKQDPVL